MPAIPSYDIADLGSLPDHPVLLRNHVPALACRTLSDLLRAVGFPRLFGYRAGDADDIAEIDAAAALADFEAGRLGIVVADSYVGRDADPGDALTVPALIEAGNLFALHADYLPLRKSLVITQAGGYTRLHVDPYGMGGWMYLYRGRKRWQLWEPAFAPMLYDLTADRCYDDAVGHGHPDARCRAVLEAFPRWEGEVGPGEILWFPEGWAHRVWTLEDSFGFGGSSLHAQREPEAARSGRCATAGEAAADRRFRLCFRRLRRSRPLDRLCRPASRTPGPGARRAAV